MSLVTLVVTFHQVDYYRQHADLIWDLATPALHVVCLTFSRRTKFEPTEQPYRTETCLLETEYFQKLSLFECYFLRNANGTRWGNYLSNLKFRRKILGSEVQSLGLKSWDWLNGLILCCLRLKSICLVLFCFSRQLGLWNDRGVWIFQ